MLTRIRYDITDLPDLREECEKLEVYDTMLSFSVPIGLSIELQTLCAMNAALKFLTLGERKRIIDYVTEQYNEDKANQTNS